MKAYKSPGWAVLTALLASGPDQIALAQDASLTADLSISRIRTSEQVVAGTLPPLPPTPLSPPLELAPVPNTLAYFRIRANGALVGDLTVELFNSTKPESVRNFLSYIQSGAYTPNVFLRYCLSNFVVQGGGYFVADPTSPGLFLAYGTVPRFAAITNEYNVGAVIPNTYGTLAMAKTGGNPNSATAEWFFNLADNSAILGTNNNGGYTVFGQVVAQTNYLDGSTNLLEFFGGRSKPDGQGIVDLTTFYGPDSSLFADLPVNYLGATAPHYSDLYAVEITAPGAPDGVLPTIVVDQPKPNAQLIVPNLTASGTAADNVGVARVQTRVNGGAWSDAIGSTIWGAVLALNAVTNKVEFRSVDLQGNVSAPVSRTVVVLTDSVPGTYNGLFYPTEGVTFDSSGSFTLTINASRSYTATLMLAGSKYKVKGTFDRLFQATNVVTRSAGGNFTVEWAVTGGEAGLQAAGRVVNASWSSPLLGYRVMYGKKVVAPFKGTYNLEISGAADSATAPGGYGYGTVKADSGGKLNFTGTLADTTRASQKVSAVGTGGAWPVYTSLYNNRGLLIGWLNFTNLRTADLKGSLTWLKQSGASTKTYPKGFTNSAAATDGAIYADPVQLPAMNFTNGVLIVSGGGLTASWTNAISINSNNRVDSLSDTKLSVQIAPTLGGFSGSFTEPGTGAKVSFTGILNQKRDSGFGHFINKSVGGSVFLGP